jgi:hypothetical protein
LVSLRAGEALEDRDRSSSEPGHVLVAVRLLWLELKDKESKISIWCFRFSPTEREV